MVTLAVAVFLSLLPLVMVAEALTARCLALSAVYLTFALSETVPPFVPTLFLMAATPVVLGGYSPDYELSAVLAWTADPILALFAGGFALGLAAQRHGLDRAFAAVLIRVGGRSQRGLLAVVLLAAAFTSMWLSNVAAAALLLTALSPILAPPVPPSLRCALLLALAVGANLGGMATPIGSGPNGIAIAEVRAVTSITFLHWMSFGVPLVLTMLLVAFLFLALRYRVGGELDVAVSPPRALTKRAGLVCALFLGAVAAWLTEPVHGVAAPTVALALTLLLFATTLLKQADLSKLDWSTLGLIAGGLLLGRLLEASGALRDVASALALGDSPRWIWLGGLVLLSALLAALMSNTASAALLIPLGLQLDPSPATAVIVALATSFGMPFPISTPPNAMVYGTGSVRTADLIQVGTLLMLLGCALVTFNGAWFLGLLGFR